MSFYPRIKSFQYAFSGLFLMFRTQPNARLHLLAVVVVALAGCYFQLQRWEWVAVVLCIGLVIAMEAINTALETLTDLVSPGHHPLAGKTKDLAAGAVLWSALMAIVIAGVIFIPKMLLLFL